MHLCDLGIMKRILEFLFKTSDRHATIPDVTFNPATIRAFNDALQALRPYVSRHDFARRPRSVKDIPRFKATEFRLFLHYIGVVLFKQFLSNDLFEHFLRFHIAIRLLSHRPWCYDDNAYAHQLLEEFVRDSPKFFTDPFVCYNLHALLHIAKDVLNHGPLYKFSAYRFENFYGYLKKFLKTNDKPLQQLARRLIERSYFEHLSFREEVRDLSSVIRFSKRHSSGPLVPNCTGIQYRRAEKSGCWFLQCNGYDNCVFLSDLSVIVVSNFVQLNNGTQLIIGRKYLTRVPLYKLPCSSSLICEFLVSDLSIEFQAWDMKNIKCKAQRLPSHFSNSGNSFAVFPLFMDGEN